MSTNPGGVPSLRRIADGSGARAPRLLGCFAAVALAAAARLAAAEPPPPTEDSIATAKRQLEILRADANTAKAGAPGRSAPSVAVPQLHQGTAADAAEGGPGTAAAEEAKRMKQLEQKSANWLVEAVQAQERADKRRKERQQRGTNAPAREEGEDAEDMDPSRTAGVDDAPTARESSRSAVDPAKAPAVVNPLDRFMAEWLSPQDLALLKSTLQTGRDANQVTATPSMPSLGSDSLAVVAGIATGEADAQTRFDSRSPPPENPYLQALGTPGAPSFAMPPPTNPATPVPASPVLEVPPPVSPPPSRPNVPEFVKPIGNEKYYQPLKRF